MVEELGRGKIFRTGQNTPMSAKSTIAKLAMAMMEPTSNSLPAMACS
jgi:hypothetical protein